MRPVLGPFGTLIIIRQILHDFEVVIIRFRCRFRTTESDLDSDLDCGSLTPLFRCQPAGPGRMRGENEAVCGGSCAAHRLPAAGCGGESGSRLHALQVHRAFTSVFGLSSLKICSTLIRVLSSPKPSSRKTARSGLRAAMAWTSSSLRPVSKQAARAF